MNYKTPGVYIEEVPSLPPSVVPVATAVPAFIGYTEKNTHLGEEYENIPVKIKGFLEFVEIFGGANGGVLKIGSATGIKVKIDSAGELEATPLDDGTNSITDINDPSQVKEATYLMYYALQMYFRNGGGPCYIVSVDVYDPSNPTIDEGKVTAGLNAVKKADEPTLLLFPDLVNIGGAAGYYNVLKEALIQCADLQDRFLICDVFDGQSDNSSDDAAITAFRNEIGTNHLRYGAVYQPWIQSSIQFEYDEDAITIEHDNSGPFDGYKLSELLNPSTGQTANTTLYNDIQEYLARFPVILPPSSAMAGIYYQVDNARGVWKAPANVSVNAVKKLTAIIDDTDQEDLNVDATGGKSINALRFFQGKGNMVWGARTLAGNDNEWRYISVRRFFNFAEESIKKATVQFVFEPNDANTWVKVRAMIENFLVNQWRAGALTGSKPEQAFFVRVGLGQTMTAQDILEGRMIIEIGMAVVRPAEFIILRFSHKMQEA